MLRNVILGVVYGNVRVIICSDVYLKHTLNAITTNMFVRCSVYCVFYAHINFGTHKFNCRKQPLENLPTVQTITIS